MGRWGWIVAGGLLGCSGNATIVQANEIDVTDGGSDPTDAHIGTSDPDASTQDATPSGTDSSSPCPDASELDASASDATDSAALDATEEPDGCPTVTCESENVQCGSVWDSCRSVTVQCNFTCPGKETCGGGGGAGHCGTFWDECSTAMVAGDTCTIDESNAAAGIRWCAPALISSAPANLDCTEASTQACTGYPTEGCHFE